MTAEQDKQEEKAKKNQEKLEEKARKDEEKAKREEEKAAKAEQKRHEKEGKRKSKLSPAAVAAPTSQQEEHTQDEGDTTAARDEGTQDEIAEEVVSSGSRPTYEAKVEASGSSQHKSEGSTSPTSKVKGWIKNRFSRGKSIGEQDKKRRSFFGGASMKDHAGNGSTASVENRSTSMHDVAMAGKADEETHASKHEAEERDSQGVSPVSTPLEEERQLGDHMATEGEGVEEAARESRKASLDPPKPIEDPVIRTSSSPTRDSRFREEMDQ